MIKKQKAIASTTSITFFHFIVEQNYKMIIESSIRMLLEYLIWCFFKSIFH